MSAQVIELLVFAAIAFFIISKLISILGTTDDESGFRNKSKFGESTGIKDITASGEDWTSGLKITKSPNEEVVVDKSLLSDSSNEGLISSIKEVYEKVDKFSLNSFIKNASSAWKMILEALKTNDSSIIEQLVDKRYLSLLEERADSYKKIDFKKAPDAKISDVTFFGNSIMIRVLFKVAGIEMEEWTFSRNQNQTGKNWYLSNIERAA